MDLESEINFNIKYEMDAMMLVISRVFYIIHVMFVCLDACTLYTYAY